MYANKCLYWEEGTLLQPQHFQIMDAKQAPQCTLLAGITNPAAWGIRTCRVREDALAVGSFVLDELDMLLPGGEHVVLGENAFLRARNFTEAWTDPELPLQVWLGLPVHSQQERNVTECPEVQFDTAKTRYVTTERPDMVFDTYGGGTRADVRFMKYNLQILFGTTPALADGLTLVPIARMVREGDLVRLAPGYVPPSLSLKASPRLFELVQSVRNTLLARSKQLEDYKIVATGDDLGGAAVTTRSIGLYMMLGVLSRYLPALESCLEPDHVHPWPVYGILRQLVGELTMFSADLSPLAEDAAGQRTVPPYDHTELGACFEAAHLVISRLTGALVTGPAHSFMLEQAPGDQWYCRLPQHVRAAPFTYWLQVRAGQEVGHVREQMGRWAKLAPMALLPALVAKSLPGIRITLADVPPAGLPRRGDTLYYILDQQDALWQSVLSTGECGLFLPDAPEGLVIHLALMQA